jgi:hypothetical protein
LCKRQTIYDERSKSIAGIIKVGTNFLLCDLKIFPDAVLELKKIKPEVEHLKHSIERQRIDMHKEFDKWFQEEAERNSLRSSSAASFTAEERSSSRPASRASQATYASLTGDAQADSDIQAFIQARQRILAQRQS